MKNKIIQITETDSYLNRAAEAQIDRKRKRAKRVAAELRDKLKRDRKQAV